MLGTTIFGQEYFAGGATVAAAPPAPTGLYKLTAIRLFRYT